MDWLLELNERRLNTVLDNTTPPEAAANLPPDVATAMNIYRHELIECIGNRHPERYAEWRGRARRIAQGSGTSVSRRPVCGHLQRWRPSSERSESPDAYEQEIVRTKALLEFARDADRHCVFAFGEYAMFTDVFAAMFRDHGPEGIPTAPGRAM